MKLKGRYIPDKYIETAPYIVDIPRGEGMTQLMVLGPEEPKKEIQCFQWDWPEPKQKPKTWVRASVVGAFVSCVAATFGLLIAPALSTAVILGDLAWLGIVAFANK